MEPVLHLHLAVRKVGRVLIHTAVVFKGLPPLPGPHTQRVDPADRGPALISGASSIFEKDAGMVIAHRVHQIDGQTAFQKIGVGIAFVHVMDGTGLSLLPETPGQTIGVQRFQHQLALQIPAAAGAPAALEAHPVLGPDRDGAAHAASPFTPRAR